MDTTTITPPHPSLTPRFPASFTLKIIGLGGVGSIVADMSALWLSAQAVAHPDVQMRMLMMDGDVFEPKNSRMAFGRLGPKAEVKCEDIADRLGERLARLTLVPVNQYIAPDNIGRLIREGDFVILCVDSHASRKLVSDYFAQHMRDGVLISAGNDGVGADSHGIARRGTFGNCQLYVRSEGKDVTPSLTQFHPEIANPADKLPTDLSCTEAGASVPQLLFANLWAAASALATLYLYLTGDAAVRHSELAFDFAEGKMVPIDYGS